MKKNLAVCLLIKPKNFKEKIIKDPYFQPLLGQTSLDLLAKTIEEIKVYKKIICGEKIKDCSELPSGWERLDLPFQEKDVSLKSWLANFFSQNNLSALFILNAAYPLLEKNSLKEIIRQHFLQKSSLTFFVPPAKEEFTSQKEEEFVLPSDFIGFIFDKEILDLINFRSADFFDGRWLELLALKSKLIKEGKRVIEISLSDKELLDVRRPQARPRIIAYLRQKKILALGKRGVSFIDPQSVWIDLPVKIGSGSIISPAVVIEGNSTIGREVKIYPFVHIQESQIGDRSTILTACVIEGSRLGKEVRIGPFTHLRPGTVIKTGAHVGNFVEMKKTVFGRRSKAMHLSYLGDSLIGDEVNIGAGTITCNYDGRHKHQTIIEKGAFIGSGTELVAPVRIGKGAYIGAGSTITKDVSPDALAIARSRQVEIPGWAKRRRNQ